MAISRSDTGGLYAPPRHDQPAIHTGTSGGERMVETQACYDIIVGKVNNGHGFFAAGGLTKEFLLFKWI